MDNDNVLQIALNMATHDLPTSGSTTDLAKITFGDNKTQNLDLFSAKKIVSCYSMLDNDNKSSFEYMLNRDAESFNKAKEFAVYNS